MLQDDDAVTVITRVAVPVEYPSGRARPGFAAGRGAGRGVERGVERGAGGGVVRTVVRGAGCAVVRGAGREVVTGAAVVPGAAEVVAGVGAEVAAGADGRAVVLTGVDSTRSRAEVEGTATASESGRNAGRLVGSAAAAVVLRDGAGRPAWVIPITTAAQPATAAQETTPPTTRPILMGPVCHV
ncbi:hypothetical protein [Jatrophihabitans fulvus]